MTSILLAARALASRSSDKVSIRARMHSTNRGVKALWTMPRRRVWSGASTSSMLCSMA